jgi:hypothetical protein
MKANIEQSERKINFLRRIYLQTKLDKRLSPARRKIALARIEQKAKWHKARIAKLNTVTVQQVSNDQSFDATLYQGVNVAPVGAEPIYVM